ncbi:Splicing factor 3B subunit 4 [Hordeum vulgare]|nr:Splicing factor 3B subunit 4 [Hordeum vulgare]
MFWIDISRWMIDRLATIEGKIDALDLREREKLMVDKEQILKIDDEWEPFVRISISNQDFLAYCDIGSMVSTMPKVGYDSLGLGMEKISSYHEHANGDISEIHGKVKDVQVTFSKRNATVDFFILEPNKGNIVLGRDFLRAMRGFIDVGKGHIRLRGKAKDKGRHYPVKVSGVEISPDPVVRGKPATFKISASTGNLDEKVPGRVLYEILIQVGHVVDLHIPCDKETGRPKGFAFAEYETEAIAQYAVRLFSGLVRLNGKTLKFASIESELKERLRKGVYGEIYNFPFKQFDTILDMEKYELAPEIEEEEEGEIEYVEGDDIEMGDMDDMEDFEGFGDEDDNVKKLYIF